ncbi:MAG: hypothetical protein PVH61_33980 [Candidatus Aminicenantes bacterium]|jgi:hypothetical protein
MKRTVIIASIFIFLCAGTFAKEGFDGRPITNNISMPTGYSVNKGEFLVGLGPIGFGISDRVQVGTNILLFFLQDYNVNLKVSLLKSDSKALAAGVKLHRFDLEVDDTDTGFTTISPFVAFSAKLSRDTTLHLGGQYSYFSGEEDIEDAVATLTSSGSSMQMGIEYTFSNRTKFLAETGYDFTFSGLRLGGAVLFGWKKFRLKLGVNYFNPENTDGFIWPVIGLYWRFDG